MQCLNCGGGRTVGGKEGGMEVKKEGKEKGRGISVYLFEPVSALRKREAKGHPLVHKAGARCHAVLSQFYVRLKLLEASLSFVHT